MITSRRNEKLKDIRRLRRCKGDEALLEGPHLLADAVAAGLRLDTVLAAASWVEGADGRRLLPALDRPPLVVADELLAEVTDSDSPRGVVAVARLPRAGVAALPATAGVYVYADGVQDPGNVGALARVAEAAGAVALVLASGSAHPNHPRALRASAGSLLRLPTAIRAAPQELRRHLSAARVRWANLAPRGGHDLYGPLDLGPFAPADGALVLATGGEGPGLGDAVREVADLDITIPLAAPVESLNATVATAVVLFELRRRARGAAPS